MAPGMAQTEQKSSKPTRNSDFNERAGRFPGAKDGLLLKLMKS